MKKLILASASPRRSEILKSLNINFDVVISDLDESTIHTDDPIELVKLLSYEKAKLVKEKLSEDVIILAADTVVALNGHVLGKPEDEQEAIKYLSLLSGTVHEVYTGITLLDQTHNKKFIDYSLTKVFMRTFGIKEIEAYVKTKEPLDKAGAYAIQGYGAVLVRKIDGDYSNVVGLPVSKLIEGFEFLGYPYFDNFHV